MITRSFVRKLPNVQMVQFAKKAATSEFAVSHFRPGTEGHYLVHTHTILYIEIIHESNVDN